MDKENRDEIEDQRLNVPNIRMKEKTNLHNLRYWKVIDRNSQY